MMRRFRLGTVLIALLTLFAYAAEGAAAVVFCDPAVTAADATGGAAEDNHAGHDPSAPTTDESGSSHENHCPLGMSGGGSCAVASLPAALPQVQDIPVTMVEGWIGLMTTLESAAGYPLFHPPRR